MYRCPPLVKLWRDGFSVIHIIAELGEVFGGGYDIVIVGVGRDRDFQFIPCYVGSSP